MREDSIPTWVAHAKPSDMDKTRIDAITGATPSTVTKIRNISISSPCHFHFVLYCFI